MAQDLSTGVLAEAVSTVVQAVTTPQPASSRQASSPVSAWNHRKNPASCCAEGLQLLHAHVWLAAMCRCSSMCTVEHKQGHQAWTQM